MIKLENCSLFSIGFRPFFFMTALVAVIVPICWILFLTDHIQNISQIDELFWHGHEMLFAFFGALITGFLLTATANWTGRKHVNGHLLLSFFLLYLLDRLVLLFTEGYFLHLGLLFWFLVLFIITQTLINNPKNRLIFIPLIFFIIIAKFFYIQGIIDSNSDFLIWSKFLIQMIIRFVIALMATRLIPFFGQRPFPQLNFRKLENLDVLTLGVVLTIPAITFFSTSHLLNQILYIIGFSILLLKWLSYHPFKITGQPIFAILVWGYFWLPFEFLLRALPTRDNTIAVDHSVYAGLLGTFAIGMMSRVSLGHTGRNLIADKAIIAAYCFVFFGAIGRITLGFVSENFYTFIMIASGVLWVSAFLIYLIKFSKILFSPRI